jgi:hypothetical protein
MIENNTSRDDVPEYLGDRARIYYEMEQYESMLVYLKCVNHIKSILSDVINDITVIEGYKEIDDDMEMLKWYAICYFDFYEIV